MVSESILIRLYFVLLTLYYDTFVHSLYIFYVRPLQWSMADEKGGSRF